MLFETDKQVPWLVCPQKLAEARNSTQQGDFRKPSGTWGVKPGRRKAKSRAWDEGAYHCG